MLNRPSRPAAPVALLALAASLCLAPALSAQAGVLGLPEEVARAPGLPEIGLWMLSGDGSIAHWLGLEYKGKKLLEPINVVIVDPFASSGEEAEARLVAACKKAGFPEREGHSSGYLARLGDELFPQVPARTEDCFSDAPFEISNNHGRIFGPLERDGAFYFAAAFSRESVDIITKVKHHFVSFDRARDSFTQRMQDRSDYRIAGFVQLGNAFPDHPELTTGDHDGMAVLLKATR